MRDDQTVRVAGMVATLLAYGAHLYLNQVSELIVGPYQVSGLIVVAVTMLTLALPETLEYIPLGPSRNGGTS